MSPGNYILKEAEVSEGGQRLGWVGSYIVAEVFVGLLVADRFSFINNKNNKNRGEQDEEWRPRAGHFGCVTNDTYTIINLLKFAGVM